MPLIHKALLDQTAKDLMSQDVLVLTEDMPLREAAHVLLRNQIGGAPVVNRRGECVGMLSSVDFMRLAGQRRDATRPAGPPLPVTCSFQRAHKAHDGRDVIVCTLPPGVCPLQAKRPDESEEPLLVCTQPNCVLADWQVVEVEKLPTDEVRRFMTADPVTVTPGTPISELARKMIDAHIHRVVVVDRNQTPLGIVSSTDLLAALAYASGNQ
jgi:CBS domain-containing protein